MLETNKTAEELLNEIKTISTKNPFSREDYFQMHRYFFALKSIFELKHITKKNIAILFEIESNIANSKKQHRQKTEKTILDFMIYLPIKLFDGNNNLGNEKAKQNAVLLLSDFAKKVHSIKIPRDAFSGKRKSAVLEMLSYLATYVEVPEFLNLAKKALKNKSKTQYIRVADSLQEYFKAVKKQPDEEIIEIIEKRCDKAKTKSELMAGLQFLVETQVISEFGALSRLDEWKEKHEYW